MSAPSAIVIDDDSKIRELMAEMLSLLKVDVLETGSSGNDAIRLYRKESPSIVFMDVHMPELDGIEALKEIKKIDSNATVVMVTGDSDPNLESTLQNLKASALICKPFGIEKIIEVLEHIKQSRTMLIQKT